MSIWCLLKNSGVVDGQDNEGGFLLPPWSCRTSNCPYCSWRFPVRLGSVFGSVNPSPAAPSLWYNGKADWVLALRSLLRLGPTWSEWVSRPSAGRGRLRYAVLMSAVHHMSPYLHHKKCKGEWLDTLVVRPSVSSRLVGLHELRLGPCLCLSGKLLPFFLGLCRSASTWECLNLLLRNRVECLQGIDKVADFLADGFLELFGVGSLERVPCRYVPVICLRYVLIVCPGCAWSCGTVTWLWPRCRYRRSLCERWVAPTRWSLGQVRRPPASHTISPSRYDSSMYIARWSFPFSVGWASGSGS